MVELLHAHHSWLPRRRPPQAGRQETNVRTHHMIHILTDKLDTPPPHVGVSKLRAYAVYTDTISRQIILIHTTCTDVENILNSHNSIV